MHRPTLGVISLVLIIGGAIVMLRPIDGDSYLGAISVRSGLVLGSIWVALPNIRKAPSWLLSSVGLLAIVLIVRPRLLLYALPVAAVVAFFGATAGGPGRSGT
ncbi:MAG: hypothetical protein OEM84_01045 [Acidimicrobiia bacterium]|nr:hypothetical protein [Acidimicrobiia bacterium]MDH5616044.1 hypothetical protein [Acidimicrobiia bacterium]